MAKFARRPRGLHHASELLSLPQPVVRRNSILVNALALAIVGAPAQLQKTQDAVARDCERHDTVARSFEPRCQLLPFGPPS